MRITDISPVRPRFGALIASAPPASRSRSEPLSLFSRLRPRTTSSERQLRLLPWPRRFICFIRQCYATRPPRHPSNKSWPTPRVPRLDHTPSKSHRTVSRRHALIRLCQCDGAPCGRSSRQPIIYSSTSPAYRPSSFHCALCHPRPSLISEHISYRQLHPTSLVNSTAMPNRMRCARLPATSSQRAASYSPALSPRCRRASAPSFSRSQRHARSPSHPL